MTINEKTIEYAAALAKLSITEEEKTRVAGELDKLLSYFDTMNGLDTEGVEPMSHVLPIMNVFREDIVEPGEDREAILSNAPCKKDGSLVVPKTVESGD